MMELPIFREANRCLFALGELDVLQIQFFDALWNATAERVTVYANKQLVFRFKNGVEVEV